MSGDEPGEIVQDWLVRARSNLQLGKTALETPGVTPEDASFNAQQCAEKAFKGLLTKMGIPFPRTHALEVLLDLLKANGINIPGNVDESYELTQYAVQTRYPGEWEPVTPEEAHRALERAAFVLRWVEGEIFQK